MRTWKDGLSYLLSLGKWTLLSLLAGILGGGIGALFLFLFDLAAAGFQKIPWLFCLLPLFGLLIVLSYRHLKRENDRGTNEVILSVQTGETVSPLTMPLIMLGALLTQLGGGSAGREGAALQMGGTIGFEVGKLLHLDDRDLRTATLAGMAAFFSALFGTPLAATIFAMAVISIGLIYHAALIPCLLASLTAYEVSLFFHVPPMHFIVSAPVLHIPMLLRVSVLAALCGFVSMLFCDMLHLFEHNMETSFPNPYLRAFVGGSALLFLSLELPEELPDEGLA